MCIAAYDITTTACAERAERRARIRAAAERAAQRAAQRTTHGVDWGDTDRHAARTLASWAALYDPTFESTQAPGSFEEFLNERAPRRD
jgi:hypothetical protein